MTTDSDLGAWIDARLADARNRRRGPIRQERSWARGVVVTFETDRGRMWAKAVPEVFAHEVALTVFLADVDPGCVPPVVAADPARGRIITEHVEGPTLSSLGDRPDAWAASLSRLAEIQRVVAAEPSALAIAGVAEAPVRGLADAVRRLLEDDDLLRPGLPDGLSAAEAADLRDRAPVIADACHALAAGDVPDSLDHGALATDEVILGEMGPVFLDWSDGSITHPFLSAVSLLADGAGGDVLAEAYLGPWLAAGIVTEAAGRAALDLARTVLPLHVAALYADRILPALGTGARSDPAVIRALRTLVSS